MTANVDSRTALPTRRELREAQGATRSRRAPASQAAPAAPARRSTEPSRSRTAQRAPLSQNHRWASRAVVLSTLAAATIAMPLTSGSGEGSASAAPFSGDRGPSTLDVVKAGSSSAGTSQFVAAAPRSASTSASRSVEREILPGCDADVRPAGTNGNLSDHGLCDLWDDGDRLRSDAAVALAAMNEAFTAKFGRNICLVASYRTLSEQYTLAYTRAGFAARPGTSMHGWGLAIDLCGEETSNSEIYGWIRENSETYGWENPDWAQAGGSGAYEPWHFEFAAGVAEMGG
ncbi:M15 family metallopeptidase [Paraoerskovia marina]|uniref:M15 family metallopeptidase n=1 Tax=Paraoerskovia marina TaxID=545619 RepID=UPI0006948DCA|nr:M15 family metallopeptidase [Paraoerskovia marina]